MRRMQPQSSGGCKKSQSKLTYFLSYTISELWLTIGQIFANNESGMTHFNALAGGDPLLISP